MFKNEINVDQLVLFNLLHHHHLQSGSCQFFCCDIFFCRKSSDFFETSFNIIRKQVWATWNNFNLGNASERFSKIQHPWAITFSLINIYFCTAWNLIMPYSLPIAQVKHGTYTRWQRRNRCARKEQSILFYLFKSFN